MPGASWGALLSVQGYREMMWPLFGLLHVPIIRHALASLSSQEGYRMETEKAVFNNLYSCRGTKSLSTSFMCSTNTGPCTLSKAQQWLFYTQTGSAARGHSPKVCDEAAHILHLTGFWRRLPVIVESSYKQSPIWALWFLPERLGWTSVLPGSSKLEHYCLRIHCLLCSTGECMPALQTGHYSFNIVWNRTLTIDAKSERQLCA